MKQLPDEKKQAEIIKQIEIAEQKAREMAELADAIAKKWEHRRQQKEAAKQQPTTPN